MNENIMNQEVVNEVEANEEVMELVPTEDMQVYDLPAEEEPEVSGKVKLAVGIAAVAAGVGMGLAINKGMKKAKKFMNGKLDSWAEKRLAKKEELDVIEETAQEINEILNDEKVKSDSEK